MQAASVKALDESLAEDSLAAFYAREELEPAHMISYAEQLQIFGKVVDYNYVIEANRRLLQSHFVLYNAAFDSLWKYKYLLLVARCVYLGGTLE